MIVGREGKFQKWQLYTVVITVAHVKSGYIIAKRGGKFSKMAASMIVGREGKFSKATAGMYSSRDCCSRQE